MGCKMFLIVLLENKIYVSGRKLKRMALSGRSYLAGTYKMPVKCAGYGV